jgi:hypothetical protein
VNLLKQLRNRPPTKLMGYLCPNLKINAASNIYTTTVTASAAS